MTDPVINFPPELPVAERREEIAAAIAANQVVILAGETGSGKTTQLPKICLQLGRGQDGIIGHTQPRRIAARSVAQRIADELGEQLGATVGYQVRFTDQSSADTRVKLMTDGILLAEIGRDRMLRKYDTLIIDEAHERSLNIDFLLGYLKQLLPKRPDLKLIVTSATIDVDSFSRHFSDAPVIEVSGRTWPVHVEYIEPPDDGADQSQQVLEAIQDINERRYGEPGDVLVFLSGEREIRELAQLLRRAQLSDLEVLPLYARLSAAEQSRVFQTRRRRGIRVILSTNVAETSLTVPGIRYVIDPGYARISRYSYRTKLQRLPVEAISQASANQRKGRCGRVAEGVCLRLYSEEDFAARPEYTEPEIRRTNLAAVILQMLRLKLGDIAQFPFIEPPERGQIKDGMSLLAELAAVDGQGRLTDVGRQMSGFPVDPRFGRMMLSAAASGCLRELLIIVSALSVQDPRERPVEKQQAADEQHRRFSHKKSDFMAWLSLWDYCEEQRQALTRNQWRRRAQKEFLSYNRLLEWRDIHFQLTLACRQAGLKQNKNPADYQAVHRALLSGLLGNLAQWHEAHQYRGSRNSVLQIFPGSSQFKTKPKWLMAAEIVETSKVYARGVAEIDPQWALEINPSLLKHHYFEPRWHARTGRVMAYDRVSLYGLVLIEKQRVHYGPIHAAEAREILVREGLVMGHVRQPPVFLRHNRQMVEDLEALESKVRRRDIVVDEQTQVEFYLDRLPDNITTINRLRAWLKRDRGAAELLRMSRQQLSMRSVEQEMGVQFPDTLAWQDFELQLNYHFEPGHERDGVSVTIPIGLLNRIPRYRFQWLVPGLLREKCIQLVKGLPKPIRKQLVPVPDYVDRVLTQMSAEDRPLTLVLGETLHRMAGVRIEPADWSEAQLDDYYRMHIHVVDGDDASVAQGRDLDLLLQQCRQESRASLQKTDDGGLAVEGLTRWPDADVPLRTRTQQAGIDIESYPALIDCGDSVAVRMLDYPRDAAVAHRRGLICLARIVCAEQVRYIRKQTLRGNKFSLVLAGSGLDRTVLVDDLIDACLVHCLLSEGEDPRSEAAFKSAIGNGRGQLIETATNYEAILYDALETLTQLRQLFSQHRGGAGAAAVADIEVQMLKLFSPEFLRDTDYQWASQYPRYLKAALYRLQRLSGQYQKDQSNRELIDQLTQPLIALSGQAGDVLLTNPELMKYRWMLEEFRVSLFSQSLGTALPVSAKRLQEQWSKVEAWLLENPT